ncbi:hypothetical protein JNJ66_00465 [Candidatus Saccharibacteria bacterium]|nr:hypothetical protein [Candidatus Saccharibacteria bacterium]
MTARKLMYVLLGLLGLMFVGTGAGMYYMHGLVRESITATNRIRIDAEVNDKAQESLAAVQNSFNDPEVQKLSEYMKQVIPPAEYKSQFVADVYKYAEDSGVSLSGVTFDESTTGASPAPAGAQAIPMSIAFGSDLTYNGFTEFVKKLENNLQHVEVKSLNMQPDATDPGRLSSASLKVELYTEK